MTAQQFIDWRTLMGWNQTEAARRLGCARNSIIAYETGRSEIPLYIKLACAELKRAKPRTKS
jgi:DNA-binding XRE family transcriptional regulator